MQRSQSDDESRIDWGIIFCVLLLALIGLASIYVAAVHDTGGSTSVMRQVVSQLIWYVIGTILVIIIMQFDSEQLWKVAPLVYWVGIFLMFAILVFYSRAYYANTGAKSWFAIGPFTFQPSEIMKPDVYKRQVHADVVTAIQLDKQQRDQLKANLAQRFGAKEVVLHEQVDPEILGGVIVHLNNKTLDGRDVYKRQACD